MSQIKPTLDDVLRDPSLLKSLTLGEALALTGMALDVELEGATDDDNKAFTQLVNSYVPEKNKQ